MTVRKMAAALPEKEQVRWLVAAAFVFLCLSTPLNLVHGYLFGEEGTTYLRYTWLTPPLKALFAPHQQYFSFFPNLLSLVVARLLPLSWAAVCSAWAVLFAHLWLAYVAASCERFTDFATRLLAVAVVLLAPGSASITTGSTQTQFVFALMCVLVLISDPARHRTSRTLAVLAGGLNGVVSCMLTPFFLYRAWRMRTNLTWLQAIILCVCSVGQGIILLHALPFATRTKLADRSPVMLLNVLSNHMLILPYLTRFVYHPLSLLGHAPRMASVAFALLSVAGFTCLARVIWSAGRVARTLLVIGGVHVCLCAGGIMGEDILGGGERYFYVANAAIALALVLRWQQTRSEPLSTAHRITLTLVGLLLFSGCVDTLRFWRLNQSGPVWADEVRRWRHDPLHTTLTANPADWSAHRMYLPPNPTYIDVPFYVFDSNTSAAALAAQPQNIFGPDPGHAVQK